jgi:hypothetical protein
MKLSNQAMGAIMMALQKCLMEQSDITKIIGEFQFQLDENERLLVLNPPIVDLQDDVDLHQGAKENKVTTGSD